MKEDAGEMSRVWAGSEGGWQGGKVWSNKYKEEDRREGSNDRGGKGGRQG